MMNLNPSLDDALFSRCYLINEGFDHDLALLIAEASEIIHVTVDFQERYAGSVVETMLEAVVVVRIVRTGFGIVVDYSIDLKLTEQLLHRPTVQ
jgi:hypothetical protein